MACWFLISSNDSSPPVIAPHPVIDFSKLAHICTAKNWTNSYSPQNYWDFLFSIQVFTRGTHRCHWSCHPLNLTPGAITTPCDSLSLWSCSTNLSWAPIHSFSPLVLVVITSKILLYINVFSHSSIIILIPLFCLVPHLGSFHHYTSARQIS